MKLLTSYSFTTRVALSHLLLRILCLLIIEQECAQLVQQSSGTPAVLGNYILASMFTLGFIGCLADLRIGFIIGILASGINIIAKLVIIHNGHEHFPYYPIVWISQSLIVAYFCYRGLKHFRQQSDTGVVDATA